MGNRGARQLGDTQKRNWGVWALFAIILACVLFMLVDFLFILNSPPPQPGPAQLEPPERPKPKKHPIPPGFRIGL